MFIWNCHSSFLLDFWDEGFTLHNSFNTRASLRGFLFVDYSEYLQEKQSRLMELLSTGKIKPAVDSTQFRGMESIVDAVEYLYSGRNCGKVIVRF
ncbi:MAG: zinc-binding dehydrogenase [Nostoc sp.]|uniref:zinc-binding dehydrogenase n=1 Tax=unclassified Nostoc TaxID=2593658 RepID=UPI002FF970DA